MVKTIRGKVTLYTIIIVGILNVFLSIFIYSTINSKLENSIKDNMENIKYMAKNIAMVEVGNNSSEEEKINGAKVIADGIYKYYGNYVTIKLNDGTRYDRGNILNTVRVDNITEESKNQKALLIFTKENKSYIATYNYPIYIEDYYLGNLVFQKDYSNEYKENYSIMISIFSAQVVMLVILIIALYTLIGKLTKPINTLSNAMKSFGEGEDIEDMTVVGTEEIAALTHSFNNMKNQINTQIDTIKKEQSKTREFFNNATHEIKTPITAISGYAQLLLQEDIETMDEEFRDRALNRMVKESNKLTILAKNILEISRGKAAIEAKREIFDFGQLVEKKIQDMQIRLIKSNIKIYKEIESVEVNLVKDEISTIVTNLLDNSIKYTAGQNVNVVVMMEDNHVELGISNKIYGLPENVRSSLLEPFVKYSDNEVLEKEGITSSGLGLYICSELAKKNCGTLSYSLEGEEIKFILKF